MTIQVKIETTNWPYTEAAQVIRVFVDKNGQETNQHVLGNIGLGQTVEDYVWVGANIRIVELPRPNEIPSNAIKKD